MGEENNRISRPWTNPLEDEGLLCKILAYLPVLKAFQLRRVCKLWNCIVTSQAFHKAWICKHINHIVAGDDDVEPVAANCCSPWLVMVRKPSSYPHRHHELVAFDSGLGTWISLRKLLSSNCSIEALESLGGPSLPLVVNRYTMPSCFIFSPFRADGSQTGLLCFLCSAPASVHYKLKEEAYHVVVLNPLTGSHTILPPALKHTPRLTYAASVAVSVQVLPYGEYRVFLKTLQITNYPGDLEIYDSSTRSWKAGRSCWSATDVETGDTEELERADFVHFKCKHGTLFAYNVELDRWIQVSAWLHQRTHGTILIRHKGRVLVASVQSSNETSLEGFVVLELHLPAKPSSVVDVDHQVESAAWIEVARTPRRLWEGFYAVDTRKVDTRRGSPFEVRIISSGSLICMTIYLPEGTVGDAAKYCVPLVYDLDRDSWYHLPPYKGHYDVAAVCGMRPSLAVVA